MVPHFHQLADIRKCETVLNVLFKLIGTKENVCIRKEFNSHRICLEHHHSRRFIVIKHQCDRCDVCGNALYLLSRVIRSAGEDPVWGPMSVG